MKSNQQGFPTISYEKKAAIPCIIRPVNSEYDLVNCAVIYDDADE